MPGDRIGGREPKGASLRRSKKNPGAAAARAKKLIKAPLGRIASLPAPVMGEGVYVDCGAGLLSRQFDRDRERVLLRAKDEREGHCAGVFCWVSDVDKQQLVADLCKANPGFCYSICGIHPDNVDRTNKKSHDSWLEKAEELGHRPECVALLTGINMNREIGTHFAQESLMRSMCAMADKLELPLVLHVGGDQASVERAIDLLRGEGWLTPVRDEGEDPSDAAEIPPHRKVFLHDTLTACNAEKSLVETVVAAGIYCLVSASGITDPAQEVRERACACIPCIPIAQMLVCTDSPWRTPQNLADAYLRTQRNEPSNIPSIYAAISAILAVPIEHLAATLRASAIALFHLDSSGVPSSELADLTIEEKAEDEDEGGEEEEGGEDVDDVDEAEEEKEGEEEEEEEIDLKALVGSSKKRHPELSPSSSRKVSSSQKPTKSKKTNEAGTSTSSSLTKPSLPASPLVEKKKSSKSQKGKKGRGKDLDDEPLDDFDLDAPMPMPAVHEPVKSAIPLDLEITPSLNAHYACQKCRASLFKQGDLTTHESTASRTVAGEGICTMAVFLNCLDAKEISLRTSLKIRGTNVECGGCGAKLGRYTVGEAHCPCGVLIPGPTARVNATKVDRFEDVVTDVAKLADRSRQEAEEARLRDAKLEELAEEALPAKKSKKRSKLHVDKTANFSNFRNKDYNKKAPKSSKGKKVEDSDGEEHTEDDEAEDEQ